MAISLMCGIWLAVPAPTARAQDARLDQAKAAFYKGRQLYTQKKFTEAAGAFLEAYAAKPIAAFLFNAAVAFEKAKQYGKAVAQFKRYLAGRPNAPDSAAIRKRIAALEKAIEAAQPPPSMGVQPRVVVRVAVTPVLPKIQTKGVVIIKTKPVGATIYLGSKQNRLGTSPWQGTLPRGKHTLIFQAKGFGAEKKEIEVHPDRMADIYVSLSQKHFIGFVTITANLPGAKVFVDSTTVGAVGKTPYKSFLKPGKHTIWVRRVGYNQEKRVVEVVSGKTLKVHVVLKPLEIGWLSVTGRSADGGEVWLDGKKVCNVPCDRLRVRPGPHEVVVKKSGMKPLKTQIEIKRIEHSLAQVRLKKTASRVSAWIAYSFAAAFVAGGITLGYLSKQIRDELASDLTQPGRLVNSRDSRFDKGRIYAYVANGLFGAAGLAALFGIYYTFANRGPKSEVRFSRQRITVRPELGPTYAGLRGTLRF